MHRIESQWTRIASFSYVRRCGIHTFCAIGEVARRAAHEVRGTAKGTTEGAEEQIDRLAKK
jgi:hypothetical protein